MASRKFDTEELLEVKYLAADGLSK